MSNQNITVQAEADQIKVGEKMNLTFILSGPEAGDRRKIAFFQFNEDDSSSGSLSFEPKDNITGLPSNGENRVSTTVTGVTPGKVSVMIIDVTTSNGQIDHEQAKPLAWVNLTVLPAPAAKPDEPTHRTSVPDPGDTIQATPPRSKPFSGTRTMSTAADRQQQGKPAGGGVSENIPKIGAIRKNLGVILAVVLVVTLLVIANAVNKRRHVATEDGNQPAVGEAAAPEADSQQAGAADQQPEAEDGLESEAGVAGAGPVVEVAKDEPPAPAKANDITTGSTEAAGGASSGTAAQDNPPVNTADPVAPNPAVESPEAPPSATTGGPVLATDGKCEGGRLIMKMGLPYCVKP